MKEIGGISMPVTSQRFVEILMPCAEGWQKGLCIFTARFGQKPDPHAPSGRPEIHI